MTGQLTDMGAAAQIFWPLWERLLDKWPEIVTATWETLQMVLLSTVFSLASGFLLAILMIVTNPLMSLRPCRPVYQVVDFVVNLLRSFPFIILLIAIIPVTRLVVGTSIGSAAAIVPLTVAAAPFVARLIEGCFLEVDKGVIEAARSFGASNGQIIFRVLLPEALPSIVLNVAVIAITLLGYSAMAGTVGGGGLGDLAVKYGYNRFQVDIMVYSVVILCILVLVIQGLCNLLYKLLR
ncbi:methionine ABC transporter permease [Desulfovibrio legallii]|uniref:ABC transporter permease n=1 Tax=Desulfovibrio legallii TaxID=571438 RepID=A0A6H3FDW6_9BACT|nr:methionine ABC transporter permease [Desulfovibrio legallii]RHH22874.1 ABC transporter permease [Desulfovibrio sp. AM18-2]TBH81175.1 ABC transporter permease [Desulfovibrio legallii]CAI3227771.1 Methionine ABC transporter permease protein [Desulfovibrio diazotrophicus]VVU43130.1 Methionine ABC transporter permease protein [Desulfovibrio diazotrophicus]